MDLTQSSFGRVVNIKVFATNVTNELFATAPTIDYNNGYTEFSSVQEDGSQGFRIRGTVNYVEAALTTIPNPISLSIYNLGKDSRNLIQSRVGTKIIVEAGYGNKASNAKQIFLGNILWAKTHKVGPDYITEIQAGDGSFALTNGSINLSFSAGVTYAAVINALIDALEPFSITAGIVYGIPSGSYNQGIVLIGSPLDLLRKQCDKLGLHYWVQNGQVTIIPLGEDLRNPVIEVSIQTGMIGIPELRTQGILGPVGPNVSSTPDNIISFKKLLDSRLVIGQKVSVVSKFINGQYIIARSVHNFDSWEGSFQTECECIGL